MSIYASARFAGTELRGGCDRYHDPVIMSTAAPKYPFILMCQQVSK